jgi:hypothetical protein
MSSLYHRVSRNLLNAATPLLALLFASGCLFSLGPGGPSLLTPLDLLANAAGNCHNEGAPADETLQQMFDNLNAYRAENGLPALRYSKNLEAAASAHAQDMYTRDFFDSVNPDGDGPWERAQAAGYCLTSVSENIGLTSSADPAAVQTGWENSTAHDTNLLGDWAYVGMGHYEAPAATAQVMVVSLTPEQLADILATLGESQPTPADGSTPSANYWVQVFGGR